jgi:hypothetical protein
MRFSKNVNIYVVRAHRARSFKNRRTVHGFSTRFVMNKKTVRRRQTVCCEAVVIPKEPIGMVRFIGGQNPDLNQDQDQTGSHEQD